ncbi:hypothetical protein AUR64_05715 [Haloprofundus marisrubri]|uniref:HTH iclR-type domain-containing protein n=1 Tax=Haloprofundus marisrubri TaxID=1514971 RepID=A0A0W1RBF1_9EURY|nr:hypothetical protein [Haloprofundus marisrubri]KTG10694.1 hypothetical protein AUR64_05715 [Haloprofundus marisrubri]
MRYVALVLAFLVLSAGFAPPAVAATVAGADGGERAVLQTEAPPDTRLIIDVQGSGDANWSVVTRYRLQGNNSTAAFEQYVSDLRTDEANATIDERTFEQFAALSSEATGREMEIRNVTYEGTVENGTGTLNMTFTWTKFADRTDQDLIVGDAFETPNGGTWFPRLEAGQELVIRTPTNWEINRNFQATRNGSSLVAEGPRDLTDESDTGNVIFVSYKYQGSGRATPGGDAEGDLRIIAGVGAVLVFAAMLAAVVLRRRQGFDDVDENIVTVDGPETPRTTGDGGSATVAPPPDDPEETEEDDVDLSLLSDGERVEHLLERNGGRMRQSNIVGETGWSDAKVSQLLSSLADEGRVEKLRLGRENLISLPDEGDDNGEGSDEN